MSRRGPRRLDPRAHLPREDRSAQRAIVVAAGPIANFLLAMVLFAGLFASMGRPVTLPVVGDVLPGSAADACRAAGRTTASTHRRPADRTFRGHPAHRRGPPGPGRCRSPSPATAPPAPSRCIPVRRNPTASAIGMLGIRGGPVEYRHVRHRRALWAGVTQTWDVTAGDPAGHRADDRRDPRHRGPRRPAAHRAAFRPGGGTRASPAWFRSSRCCRSISG